MMIKIKKLLIRILEFTPYLYARSYSQEGEDMILKDFFSNQKNGFFVDIGAHHPKRFSNTYFFYKRGWRGINVDPKPGIMRYFRLFRKKDINIEIGISSNNTILNYYMFDEPAINTFSENDASAKRQKHQLLEKKKIKVIKLEELLKIYLPKEKSIDFMTIDAEGMDFEILQSNDWDIYRPKLLLIEFKSYSKNDINNFLFDKGYIQYAQTSRTAFYLLKKK